MLSTFNTLQKVYKERALILNKIFQPTNEMMDCACNVSQLIDKYLMQNLFSYNVSQECSACKWMDHKNIKVLER